jgi:hypothetical protein
MKTRDPIREAIKLIVEPVAHARGLIPNSIDEASATEFTVEEQKAGDHKDRETWDRHGADL